MARIFLDGFETNQTDQWDGYQRSAGGVGGVGGDYFIQTSGALTKTFSTTYPYLYFSAYFKTAATLARTLMSFYNGSGTVIACLKKNGSSPCKLEAYRGTTTLLATGTAEFSLNVWHHIEVFYHPDSSAGDFEVKMDVDTLDINYSGNTSAGTTLDRFSICDSSATVSADNIVVDSSSWIGDSRICPVLVTGDSTSNWTPSAGSNYACVDEIPPVLTDYVSTTSNDIIDWYTAGDCDGGVIKCVLVQTNARRSGLPTPTKLKVGVSSGGTPGYGTAVTIPQAKYMCVTSLHETDPATGSAWASGAVDAALIGQQSQA